MRLDRFNPANIKVRGGGSGGAGGKLGCGAIVIAIHGAVFFGLDPMSTLGTLQQMDAGQQSEAPGGQPRRAAGVSPPVPG